MQEVYMNKTLRYGLFLALVLALTAGTGCPKKVDSSTPTAANEYGDAAIDQATFNRVQSVLSNQTIYFEFDRYDLKQESKDRLAQSADIIKQVPKVRVLIEGHTDERGTAEYNLALGERRARAAYEYLLMLGVRAEQLEMISYGKERPAVDGHGEAAWARNRRAEFKVVNPVR